MKCLPTEHEEPPPRGIRLRRRSRLQPRSPWTSLRSLPLSRMPGNWSHCELTATFLITFKKPDRAGKTGSMRRCERQLGSRPARRANIDDARSNRVGRCARGVCQKKDARLYEVSGRLGGQGNRLCHEPYHHQVTNLITAINEGIPRARACGGGLGCRSGSSSKMKADRSACARSMAGRRFPPSPSVSQLTLPLDQIASSRWRLPRARSHHIPEGREHQRGDSSIRDRRRCTRRG